MTHTGTLPRKNLFQIFFLFAITFLAFTSTPAFAQGLPTFESISPSQGSTSGGTAITIRGSNFLNVSSVTIAFTPCTSVVVVDATRITAVTPVGTAGIKPLGITNPSGTLTVQSVFTYVATPPIINSVDPSFGSVVGGTSITLNGTGFTGATSVTVGSAQATNLIVVSDLKITAVTPPGAVGAKDVAVTATAGTGTKIAGFTYQAQQLPTISAVNPNSGPTTGGTLITITGTNFAQGATVLVGAVAATNVVFVSATSITANTPAGAVGFQTVTVTNPNGGGVGISVSPIGFTYYEGTVEITSLNPSIGTISGGTIVTITGKNLINPIKVKFGEAVATITAATNTAIVVTAPAHALGTVNVTVEFPAPQLPVVKADGFTYVEGIITSFTPSSGSTAGEQSILISGIDFSSSTHKIDQVAFGFYNTKLSLESNYQNAIITGIATNLVVNATEMTCRTPAQPPSSSSGMSTIYAHYDNNSIIISSNKYSFNTPAPAATASLGTSTTAVQITWPVIAGATGYQVFRRTLSTSAYATNLATDLKNGVEYTILTMGTTTQAQWRTAGAGTATTGVTNLQTGVTYKVVTLGTTTQEQWVSAGATAPVAIGNMFVATGSTVGTGTASFTQSVTVSATSFQQGLNYTIVNLGNTTEEQWISVGATAPVAIGNVFVATGSTLGNGTAYTPSIGIGTSFNATGPTVGTGTAFYSIGNNSPMNALASTRGNNATLFNDTSAVRGVWYSYSIKALTSIGSSTFGPSSSGWRGVEAPTGVNASQGTFANKVMVKWNAVAGATGYSVYRDGVNITAPTGTVKTTKDDTTAVPSVVYTYTVTANTAGGPSALSEGATGYSTIAAPANVAASDGTSSVQVTVTWDAAAGATGYTIFRAIGSATPTEIGTTAALTFDDTTAVPATIYTYTVKSTSAGNASAASVPTTGFRALAAPTPVAASQGTSTTKVTVTWGASPSAKGYQVFRATGGGEATRIATLGTVLTYADTTAVVGTLYTYTLFATSPISTSVASAGADGYRNINAPTGVQATDGTSTVQVTVTWAAVTSATGYQIFRNATLAGTVGAVRTFADTGATPGVQYNYTVKATTSVATSAASAGNTGYRNLSAPTGVAASKGTYTTKIQVTWLATTGASGYSIFRNGATTAIGTTVGNTAVIYNDTTALANKIYYYTVRAKTTVATSALSLKAEGYRASAFTDDEHGSEGQKTGGNDGRDIATGGNGAGNGLGNGSENGQTTTTSDDTGPLMGIALYLQTISEQADVFGDCDDASNLASTTTETETSSSATNTDAAQSMNLDLTTNVLNVEVNTDSVHEAANADIGLTISGAIDLDHNGEPDICQLRRGDLDLNGIIDIADMEILLNMVNSEPVLGIGDMDQNDVLDSADVGLLLGQM